MIWRRNCSSTMTCPAVRWQCRLVLAHFTIMQISAHSRYPKESGLSLFSNLQTELPSYSISFFVPLHTSLALAYSPAVSGGQFHSLGKALSSSSVVLGVLISFSDPLCPTSEKRGGKVRRKDCGVFYEFMHKPTKSLKYHKGMRKCF